MNYNGNIYRPPIEANTMLIPVCAVSEKPAHTNFADKKVSAECGGHHHVCEDGQHRPQER